MFGIRKRLGLCAVVLVSIAATACGGDSDSSGTTSGGEAQSGGTLTYLSAGEPSSLLPDVSAGAGVGIGFGGAERFAIYDALTILLQDGEQEHRLAESITSDDNTVWTLKVRDGIQFSDGTPLDAAAVESNWSRMADPAQRSPSAPIAQTIESMSVVDPTTLEVTLAEPNSQFSALIAQTPLTFIASPTAWDAAGADFGLSPVGAGPYLVNNWQRGAQLVLDRNPNYHDETYLDEIVVKYIVDRTQQVNTLTTGGGDLVAMGDLTALNTALQQPNIEDLEVVQSGGWNVFFNLTRPPFDDLRARQAIAYALDAEALNETVNGGQGVLAPTMFLEDSEFFSDVPQPQPDAEKAQELFDELASEGTPLEFTVPSAPTTQTVIEWLQAHLSGFDNVTMSIEPAGTQIQEIWRSGNFDLGINTGPRLVVPSPLLSNALETGGSTNFGQYSNPDVDAAFDAARTSSDSAEQVEAYEAVQRAQVEDLPLFFFQHQSVHMLYAGDRVHDFEVFADGVPRWDRISAGGS